MKNFDFSAKEKILFYCSYLFYKIITPFGVKSGRLNILCTEFVWVLGKIFNFRPFLVSRFSNPSYYETIFGKFYINPDLISTIAVSPSFERREMDHLLKMISTELKKKKKVLFIDVGAFFGLYTVAVGNRFKKNPGIRIISFEPGTNYLSSPTFKLLKRNIEINKLKNIKIYHVGLGSKNSDKPNNIGVKTKKLDSIISKNYVKSFDTVFMKIDVDGYEKGVMEGSKELIKYSDSLIILIEDFVDNKIISYLEDDFKFISKPSPYNSFWTKI